MVRVRIRVLGSVKYLRENLRERLENLIEGLKYFKERVKKPVAH